ncbi:putative integral membrane protein, partial [human gut metagenome]
DTGPQPMRSAEDSERLLAVTAGAVERKRPARVPTEVRERLASRERMLADGVEPYPACVTVTSSCAAALAAGPAQPTPASGSGSGSDDAAAG